MVSRRTVGCASRTASSTRRAASPWQPVLKHERVQLVAPGEIVGVEIEILPSSTRFEPGERLRLVISGRDVFSNAMHHHRELCNQGRHTLHTGGAYLLHRQPGTSWNQDLAGEGPERGDPPLPYPEAEEPVRFVELPVEVDHRLRVLLLEPSLRASVEVGEAVLGGVVERELRQVRWRRGRP